MFPKPKFNLLGTKTFRKRSKSPNYVYVCRQCKTSFDASLDNCPHCTAQQEEGKEQEKEK